MPSTLLQSHPRRSRFLVERLEIRNLLSSAAVYFDDPSTIQFVSDKVGSVVVTFGEDSNLFSTGEFATETVSVTVGGGTAVAGLDYQPVQQTFTLTPEQPTAQLSIPILPGSASLGTRLLDVTIAPSATNPRGSTEFIAIQHGTDITLPKAVSAKTEIKGSRIVAFSIQFSKDMALGPVQNIANYAIPDPSTIKLKNVGSQGYIQPIALKSAIYDAPSRTVVLIPAGDLKFSKAQIGKVKLTPKFYTILDPSSFNGLAKPATAVNLGEPPAPLVVSPLTDLVGNPITDGNVGSGPNGDPGSFAVQGPPTKVDALTTRILQSGSAASSSPTLTTKHPTTSKPHDAPKSLTHHG